MFKNFITSAPFIAYPDFSKPFIVNTDASNGAVGRVLSYIAVVNALQKFRCYLDQTFLLLTDHAAQR